jgi:hypothetical protein
MKDIRLPKFDYHLDHSDKAVIKRQDGSFVAAFSAGPFTLVVNKPAGGGLRFPPRRQ